MKTFCLFHGTGGDENDLIPVASAIDPDAGILSLRGNVKENGMNRFFKRLSEGVFDEDNIRLQSRLINEFLKKASKKYAINLQKTILLGFSNGSNIATALLFLYPYLAARAVLFRPMVPFEPDPKPDLKNHRILITAGTRDSIVPMENTQRLINIYKSCGAHVDIIWLNTGHGLVQEDIIQAKEWDRHIFNSI